MRQSADGVDRIEQAGRRLVVHQGHGFDGRVSAQRLADGVWIHWLGPARLHFDHRDVVGARHVDHALAVDAVVDDEQLARADARGDHRFDGEAARSRQRYRGVFLRAAEAARQPPSQGEDHLGDLRLAMAEVGRVGEGSSTRGGRSPPGQGRRRSSTGASHIGEVAGMQREGGRRISGRRTER
jgi:hypothetical protein